MANCPHVSPFPKKFPMQQERKPCFGQSSQSSHSKILPLFRPKPNSRPKSPASTDGVSKTPGRTPVDSLDQSARSRFPAAEAAPYVPVGHYRRIPCHNMAPSVTIRTAVPVFSAPPLPPPPARLQQLPPLMSHPPPIRMASPVRMRPAPASPMFASSSPVQVPKPVMPVQLKDVQDHSRKEAVPPVIPVQVKDAQCRPRKSSMSPVIPVPVKDAQRRPAAIPVQMKDVQTQAPKEPLAAPISVKTDTPAQVKEASAGATSEAPSSATGNDAAVECSASSESGLARQSGAADGDTLVLMRKLSMRPEAQAAAATTMRLETN